MRRALAVPAVAALLVLTGCAPTVSLTPAPQATSAACASVVTDLPSAIGDARKRTTDAQGTAAWGDDPAVTLRCGVSRAPSSQCGTVDGVDWTTDDTTIDGRRAIVQTTFGRAPEIQVVVPVVPGSAGPNSQDVLAAVTDAVRDGTRATGQRCGASGPVTPGPTTSP